MELRSPDGNIVLTVSLDGGRLRYALHHGAQALIAPSGLGFEFRDAPPLGEDLELESKERRDFDERWETVWGERRWVHHQGHQLTLALRERRAPGRRFAVELRCYDDGAAFRVSYPAQGTDGAPDGQTEITAERTEFNLTGDHLTYWQPGDWDSYEHLYECSRFSEIDALRKRNHPDLLCSFIPENAVNTPVTMRTAEGLYLGFHEAALRDYADMTLRIERDRLRMVSALVGSPDGTRVRTRAPWCTPWRTIQVAERAGDLIESDLLLNLNAPNRLGRPAWIRPTKYAGIWWAMHLGKWTWHRHGHHGATTARAKRYIDFCAQNGIGAVLVEGWNTGWERIEDERQGAFDFVTPYPDYDPEEVVRYARDRRVQLIMHHETASDVSTYDRQLDRAFQRCRELGIHAVKTGYVGSILPAGEHHHGQWMVRHYQRVVEKAAEYQLMLDVHEPIKPTGLQRTWPNLMTCEGVRGQEFNAWSSEGGNPPEHLPRVAFTRMLAGPLDYTPGILEPRFDPYRPNNRLRHTLAHELALYVVLYSPWQMVADLPEHYTDHPALQFIRDVPADWEATRVLEAEVGSHVTIARQQRDAPAWFIGSITGARPRLVRWSLDFLPDDRPYDARIYADPPGTSWEVTPRGLDVSSRRVTRHSTLELQLAAGGGAAVSLM